MKHNKAFTLIELLVVVLIIGILAAVAVPQYRVAVLKSQYTQVISIAEKLFQAEQVYFLANGNYTTVIDELDFSFPNSPNIDWLFVEASATSYKVGVYLKNKEIGYETYLQGASQHRQCMASTSSDRAQQVCHSLTGHNKTSWSTAHDAYIF